MNYTKWHIVVVILAFLLTLAGCGSGSSGSASSAQTTTVSGSVYAAPVSGAAVFVMNSAGTTTIAGPVTTDTDGRYSIGIPSSAMTGTLLFGSSGGTFTDEATGATTTAGSLAAYMPAGSMSSTISVNLDPSSTIIAGLVRVHSVTIAEADAAFASAFGFAPDTSIAPRNEPYSAASTTAQRLAGLRAMAFSRLTKDLGLNQGEQFDLLEALSEDLADGSLDGMNGAAPVALASGSVPEDIMNRFENALVSCLSDTVRNRTGLTVDQVGDLSFAKVALTPTYRVEYVPMGMSGPKMGKTMFKIRITNRSSGLAEPGLTLRLMPMMHMSTRNHATPAEVSKDNGDGTYTCAAYYLMASGPNMGFWEMKVMIGLGMSAEIATFHPAVGMSMATDDTPLFKLYGASDVITGMMPPEKRTYLLFNDGLISGATSTFNLFIATKESMMNFPPVSIGTVLSSPTGSWAVAGPTTALEASLVNDFSSGTVSGFDNGGGHWSLPGINGLSTGITTTMYVRFTVNSEIKTAGTTTSAAGYATFKVTP
jgi:hypothetical protein